MKNYLPNFIMILFWIIIQIMGNNAIAQMDKQVIWLHGLNDGNNEVWNTRYAQEFANNRRMISIATQIGQTDRSGVPLFAERLDDRIPQRYIPIAVGHSMGGMALREIDVNRRNSLRFGGIITVGSPLRGARIINQTEGVNFAYYAGYNLTRSLFSAMIYTGSLTPFTSALAPLGYYGTSTFSFWFIYNKFREMVAPQFAMGNTRNDLQENGNYVTQIGNTSTTTPKIHIWGNENNPVVWNMAESYTSGWVTARRANAVASTSLGLYFAYFWNGWARRNFYYTYLHFKNNGTADAMWNRNVIGSYHTETRGRWDWRLSYLWSCNKYNVVENHRKCSSWGWFSWVCTWVRTVVSVVKCFWKTVWTPFWRSYQVIVTDPSDGVVPSWSQRGDGQRWSGGSLPLEARGVNHAEYGDHEQMDRRWLQIWRGDAQIRGNNPEAFIVHTRE